jgi:hypothetical protein
MCFAMVLFSLKAAKCPGARPGGAHGGNAVTVPVAIPALPVQRVERREAPGVGVSPAPGEAGLFHLATFVRRDADAFEPEGKKAAYDKRKGGNIAFIEAYPKPVEGIGSRSGSDPSADDRIDTVVKPED